MFLNAKMKKKKKKKNKITLRVSFNPANTSKKLFLGKRYLRIKPILPIFSLPIEINELT